MTDILFIVPNNSFESIPLPTNELSASRVLELRDQKFNEYFDREEF